MATFTLQQRTHNSDVSTTVSAKDRDEAIEHCEEIFNSFPQIIYMSLKEGLAKRSDPEFWAKSR